MSSFLSLGYPFSTAAKYDDESDGYTDGGREKKRHMGGKRCRRGKMEG
jgi:hypothetical protein